MNWMLRNAADWNTIPDPPSSWQLFDPRLRPLTCKNPLVERDLSYLQHFNNDKSFVELVLTPALSSRAATYVRLHIQLTATTPHPTIFAPLLLINTRRHPASLPATGSQRYFTVNEIGRCTEKNVFASAHQEQNTFHFFIELHYDPFLKKTTVLCNHKCFVQHLDITGFIFHPVNDTALQHVNLVFVFRPNHYHWRLSASLNQRLQKIPLLSDLAKLILAEQWKNTASLACIPLPTPLKMEIVGIKKFRTYHQLLAEKFMVSTFQASLVPDLFAYVMTLDAFYKNPGSFLPTQSRLKKHDCYLALIILTSLLQDRFSERIQTTQILKQFEKHAPLIRYGRIPRQFRRHIWQERVRKNLCMPHHLTLLLTTENSHQIKQLMAMEICIHRYFLAKIPAVKIFLRLFTLKPTIFEFCQDFAIDKPRDNFQINSAALKSQSSFLLAVCHRKMAQCIADNAAIMLMHHIESQTPAVYVQ